MKTIYKPLWKNTIDGHTYTVEPFISDIDNIITGWAVWFHINKPEMSLPVSRKTTDNEMDKIYSTEKEAIEALDECVAKMSEWERCTEEDMEENDEQSIGQQIDYYLDKLDKKEKAPHFVIRSQHSQFMLAIGVNYRPETKENTIRYLSSEWLSEDELLDELKSRCKTTKEEALHILNDMENYVSGVSSHFPDIEKRIRLERYVKES